MSAVLNASLSGEERAEAGRSRRAGAPRSGHADWVPAVDRPDPIEVLEAQARTRVPELVPLRYGRMLASPFAFLRGAAAVMAADLVSTPSSGLLVQACGDAHVSNFGEFATPERNVVFDLNDFDETFPGPWEWDVKRLAASLAVVGVERRFSRGRTAHLVRATVREYRERLAGYAQLPLLDRWYAQISAAEVIAHFPRQFRPLVRADMAKARRKTQLRAVTKLTEMKQGQRRFVEDPPVLVHLERTGHDLDEVRAVIDGYRESLGDEQRVLFDQFRVVDVARKVVGVGSVGTRCWVGLFNGPGDTGADSIVLQLKEAGPSVLEAHLPGPGAAHSGLRVVSGQRLIQAASDVFLGWTSGPISGRHYYGRQLWDIKGQGDPMLMGPCNLEHYAQLCAWALARAHARTGDPVAISGYLGRGDAFDRAITEFAQRYATQTRKDFAALAAAVADGRISAEISTDS